MAIHDLNTAAGDGATPAAPAAPRRYKGREETSAVWEEVFLKRFSTEGGRILSAKEAGTTWPKVKAHLEANPRFARLFEEAEAEFVENLERRILQLGNGLKGQFLSYMARLKAAAPHKYNDKLQVSGAIAHVHGAPPADQVVALLREMLADAGPETRAALTGGDVVDAEIVP
jgi:hypothetical protein